MTRLLALLAPTLAALLAPFRSAFDQEFGPRPVRGAGAHTPPAPAEVEVPVSDPVILIETPAPSDTFRSRLAAERAEVLFTRRGEGRGARYAVAGPDAGGVLFRRVAKGKRTVYEPVA
jgi:hypothetical protein